MPALAIAAETEMARGLTVVAESAGPVRARAPGATLKVEERRTRYQEREGREAMDRVNNKLR